MGVEKGPTLSEILGIKEEDCRVRHVVHAGNGAVTADLNREGLELRSPKDITHLMIVHTAVDKEGKRIDKDHVFITTQCIEQKWYDGVVVTGYDKKTGELVMLDVHPFDLHFLDSGTAVYYPARTPSTVKFDTESFR